MSDPMETSWDAVVVGGGPAGIFAAYKLAAEGARVLLVEASQPMVESLCPRLKIDMAGKLVRESERFRQQCPRCTCLTGLGGAAFHFDTSLGYASALGRSKVEQSQDGQVRRFSSLERTLAPFERAEQIIKQVFDVFHRHGLPEYRGSGVEGMPSITETSQFASADLGESQSITVDIAISLVESMMARYASEGGAVWFGTRATSIRRGGPERYLVSTDGDRGHRVVAARSVVVAVGKLGLPWVRSVIQELGVESRPAPTVDIGVRIEGSRDRMSALVDGCSNPKLAYINERGESVRTFCVCAGGRIMQYAFDDETVLLDGQHSLMRPTRRTNFGVVTTVAVPPDTDGTEFALDVARDVTRRGGGRPVACTVGELRRELTGAPALTATSLDTSLVDVTHASLAECLPNTIIDDVLGMIERLEATFPGMIDDSDVVAAPIVERLYPRIDLSGDMESSEPGLYFVGDASSKIIGVTYGAATGLAAAHHILGGTSMSAVGPAGHEYERSHE